MPAKGPVNVKWQIILVLLPMAVLTIGGIFAAYRIKRLRKFVAVYVILFVSLGISNIFIPNNEYYMWSPISILEWNPFYYYFFIIDGIDLFGLILYDVIWCGTLVFFIHRWSTQWNKEFRWREGLDGLPPPA